MANGPYRTRPPMHGGLTAAGRRWARGRATEGVLGRRFFGYLDRPRHDRRPRWPCSAVLIGIVGLLTLGLGWALFALLPLHRASSTTRSPSAARRRRPSACACGLRVVDATRRAGRCASRAAVHALLFYVAASDLPALGRRHPHRLRPRRPAAWATTSWSGIVVVRALTAAASSRCGASETAAAPMLSLDVKPTLAVLREAVRA